MPFETLDEEITSCCIKLEIIKIDSRKGIEHSK